MAKQVKSGNSRYENDIFELRKLREMAKIASIYHRREEQFHRNKNLSHIVHASLNIFQFMIILAIEIFHHTHHSINKNRRDEDDSIPHLPEERNPLFFIYPICMSMSIVFAIVWIFSSIFIKRSGIPLAGCFIATMLLLLIAIMEMKHVDMYIDLTEISDEELLTHPVFIHNFIMCLLTIFCMTIYMIQGWTLFDYCIWVRKQRNSQNVSDNMQDSDWYRDPIEPEFLETEGEVSTCKWKKKEKPGELDPIPSLDKFPSLSPISQEKKKSIQEEPVILYCCFVDWYNYIKQKRVTKRPINEFQVVHVM